MIVPGNIMSEKYGIRSNIALGTKHGSIYIFKVVH